MKIYSRAEEMNNESAKLQILIRKVSKQLIMLMHGGQTPSKNTRLLYCNNILLARDLFVHL